MQFFVVSLFGGDYVTATLSRWAFTVLFLVNRQTASSFYLSWNFMTPYIIYLRTYYLKRFNMKSIACFWFYHSVASPSVEKNDNFNFFKLILLAMSFVITFLVASLAKISWNWRHHCQSIFCFVFCFFSHDIKVSQDFTGRGMPFLIPFYHFHPLRTLTH